MNINQIEELRITLLYIMDEIHRVCEENQINYYIIGGTAIGAVRHKGFIPWDTDIDIAMRREDYERFLSIANEKLSHIYHCAYYKNSKNWYRPHAVVFKTDTMIHWNKDVYLNKKECPVYVDVMPLDYAPLSLEDKKKQEDDIKKKRYFQKRRECVLYKRNSCIERLLKKSYSYFLRLHSEQKFNESLDAVMRRYSNKKTGEICSMASHYSYTKQCMDVNIYGKPRLYSFEGREYYGPEKMDAYLTKIFGDYMKLPPEDKRTEYLDHIGHIDFDYNVVS